MVLHQTENQSAVQEELLIELKNVSKSFPGVKTLDQVSFQLRPGEVHALVGENGAGKSSLIKIISGVYQPDEGEIYLFGKKRTNLNPRITRDLGIAVIHQELSLVPQMNAVQNLFLGRENASSGFLLNHKKAKKEATEIFERLDLKIDLDTPVHHLPLAQQQMIEIARCLHLGAKVIIMDEPTSSLTEKEVRNLFNLVESLKKQNIGIVYISHFFNEIFQLSDRATILRDGLLIDTVSISSVTEDDLTRMMVGRDLSGIKFRTFRQSQKSEVLRIENLTYKDEVQNVSLQLHEGEILGLAGIVGAGRTTLARLIMGDLIPNQGKIYINGEERLIRRPQDAIRAGIAYVPEDRKGKGLVLGLSIKENITLPIIKRLTNKGWVRNASKEQVAKKYINELKIKPPHLNLETRNLSGGNQQKVVLAKWLAAESKIFIFNEPTRGIDIGAKHEIYRLLDELAKNGCAILLISSEMTELLGLSDRIAVMRQGIITKEFPIEEATEDLIIKHAIDYGGETA